MEEAAWASQETFTWHATGVATRPAAQLQSYTLEEVEYRKQTQINVDKGLLKNEILAIEIKYAPFSHHFYHRLL